MPPRSFPEPISLVLYEDPLWPWCLVAERRIRAAAEQIADMFAPLRLEPFPLRPEPRAPSRSERRVREAFEDAVDKGIEGAPALVIGDEWLLVGPRTADEYGTVLRRYVAARLGLPPRRTVH